MTRRSSGVELDLSSSVAEELLGFLRPSRDKPPVSETVDAEDPAPKEGDLEEAVATKRIQGSIQLRGFERDVVDSISANIRFRIQAANLGNRIRLIIDIQK